MRFGEEDLEGYSDMILPLLNNEQNIIFFNPRVSLMNEGANEFNLGLGYRRLVTNGLVLGGNVFVDSRESAHGNRFNQWGAGVELLSQYVDFRANYYDADNDKEKIGQYSSQSQETVSQTTSSTRASSSTTAKVRPGTGGYSDPYAEGHGIYYDQYGGTITDYTTRTNYTTTYRTTTTTTTTSKWFEQYEAGMDGWDAELGFKLPLPIGPEVRLFGGYYSYDNPFGDDVDGLKARLEVKTGPYLALDAEVFEDETLNGSDFFVGARLQIPFSRDLSWGKFVDGLVSMEHRSLDERMRSEMVQRDVRVQTSESDWQENIAKREVDVQNSVSTRTSKHSKTTVKSVQDGTPGEKTKITLADKITFVDKDNAADTAQDGTNEHPYGDDKGGIQKAVDNAGENSTIFVYEAGGQVNGINRDAGDQGGVYDEEVRMKPGQTITSEITFTGHPTQTSYATVNKPLIKPSTVTNFEIVDNNWGETYSYAAAVIMPENTTLQRMAVETSQDDAAAVWVQPQLGSGSVRIEGSELRTSGIYADGLRTYLSNASLEDLTIARTSISTGGEISYGIWLTEENNSSLGSLNVTESSISTLGRNSNGIGAYIESSNLGSLNVTDSAISTEGEHASALFTYLGRTYYFDDGRVGGPSSLGSLSVTNTRINTAGAGADGLYTSISDSSLGSLSVNDTSISTAGESASGLSTWLHSSGGGNSSLGSLDVTGTSISTSGAWARALSTYVGANGLGSANLDSLSMSNTSITTTGEGAAGMETQLSVQEGGSISLGSLNVTENSISTGNLADGLTMRASTYNGGNVVLGSVNIAGNTVNTTDSYAAIRLDFHKWTDPLNPVDSTIRLDSQSIQENNLTVQGDWWATGITVSGSSTVSPTPAFDAAALESGNTIEVSGTGAQKVKIDP